MNSSKANDLSDSECIYNTHLFFFKTCLFLFLHFLEQISSCTVLRHNVEVPRFFILKNIQKINQVRYYYGISPFTNIDNYICINYHSKVWKFSYFSHSSSLQCHAALITGINDMLQYIQIEHTYLIQLNTFHSITVFLVTWVTQKNHIYYKLLTASLCPHMPVYESYTSNINLPFRVISYTKIQIFLLMFNHLFTSI